METEQRYCFTHSDGEDIYLFTLRNERGDTATITNYGATITSYRVINQAGAHNDIVLGFDDPREYLSPAYLKNYPWMGCAVGRYANRIKNGQFELEGKKYKLPLNNGNEHLHGGPGGFDRRCWILSGKGDGFLELKYVSPDGEEGYPGTLEVSIRFELNDTGDLSYEFTATTDQPTPVNLTHHAYFNLNNGIGTIHEHDVRIPASHMLEQDTSLTATGNILPVDNTAFDFRAFRKIGEGLLHVDEFDKSFIVDDKNGSLQFVAEAKTSSTHLQIFSTEAILHFYSGKWIPELIAKNGTIYGPFCGFCMETHSYPNAVNLPQFPDTILRPGEVYRQKTVYRIGNRQLAIGNYST